MKLKLSCFTAVSDFTEGLNEHTKEGNREANIQYVTQMCSCNYSEGLAYQILIEKS